MLGGPVVTYVELKCPRCGAPLPSTAPTGEMHCTYCAAPLVPSAGGVRLQKVIDPADLPDPDRPRLWLGGRRYVLLGHLGSGEGSEVFLGRRDHRLAEQVVVKVMRAREDQDLMAHEFDVLQKLQRATHQGAHHFTRLLPEPIAHGEARLGVKGNEGLRTATVIRHSPGFVHDFDEVRAAHPKGIHGTATVWIWKRILEILAWMHQTGWVHGAILPKHLLVHARDHGVRLIGFSRAARRGQPLKAFTANAKAFYPAAVWEGGPASPATDLTMNARSMLWLVGSGQIGAKVSDVPKPLADLLMRVAGDDAGGETDAWALLETVKSVAREAFGPPKYVPFPMPGWD